MKLHRDELVAIVAELLWAAMNDGANSLNRGCGAESGPRERVLSSSEENPRPLENCFDPLNPFHVICDEKSPKECPVFMCGAGEEEHWDFRCDGKDYFSCGIDPSFECNSKHFECLKQFTCNAQSDQNFECEAEVFSCSPAPPSYFECSHSTPEFNCKRETKDRDLYDFLCDPGMEGGGYDCLPQESFECSGEHIFRCQTIFTCPTKHYCRPAGECLALHPWEPDPGDDDDGNPGDFDCSNFTCGTGPGEKFDCQAGSQFKCLDRVGGKFNCGRNATFECGDEGESFVCHEYGFLLSTPVRVP